MQKVLFVGAIVITVAVLASLSSLRQSNESALRETVAQPTAEDSTPSRPDKARKGAPHKQTIYAEPPAPTAPPECICMAVVDHVCGHDLKTYQNSCLAACAGVDVLHDAECTPEEQARRAKRDAEAQRRLDRIISDNRA